MLFPSTNFLLSKSDYCISHFL